jgi:hypothetical protein
MFDIFYIGNAPEEAVKVNSIIEAQQLSRTRYCWVLNYLCDYTDFDFLWEPKPWDSQFIHAWASQWQQDSETYLVPKAPTTDTKYHSTQVLRLPSENNWVIPDTVSISEFDFSWHPSTVEDPYIYQAGTQHQRTGGPKYVVPGATEVKYIPVRALALPDKNNWTVTEGTDTTEFDFSWHPNANEKPYIYQIGTQHQKTGGPKYVVPGATEVKYIGEIKLNHISVSSDTVYLVDHGNAHADKTSVQMNNSFNTVVQTRFMSSYLGTLKRIVRKLDTGHVWITSSLCNYTDFDFSWHPEQWQSTMLHVFPSNEQKFGDTFLVHVESFNNYINDVELLEWFNTINVVTECSVPRWPMLVVGVKDDSIVDSIKEHNFNEPLVLFTNDTSKEYAIPTVNMWREKTRTVIPLSKGANTTLVTRDAKNHISTQVYDYPYISKKHISFNDNPLDIIYISNGESNAEKNWDHLLTVTKGLPNKINRVDKVDGRVQAYQQAAKLSDTAWFFAVFAKLQVNENFDWNWQPDRLQQSKHYIFHAKNPITGLEYGHMAMIAYNKKLVLNNNAPGLDFTLDQEHEVVPVISGTAYYADNIGTAWRSAFREVIKLKDSSTIDNEYRLQKWLDSSDTELGVWSQRGAEDAVEYYENVNGEFSKLRLSYEWKWLNDYFNAKYGKEHVL